MEKERLRKIARRGNIVLILMLAFAAWILFELFSMQVNEYQYCQSKVIDNIQQEYTINAERGQIYDSNMTPLAVNITTYRIFLDPVAILNGSSSRDGEETANMWESAGVEGYEITPAEKETVGTDIILYLKEDTDDDKFSEFMEYYKLRELIKKYSDYIVNYNTY